MKKFIQENWFKVSLIILLLIFVFTLRMYLLNKNEIESDTQRAICNYTMILNRDKLTTDQAQRWVNFCSDIIFYNNTYEH